MIEMTARPIALVMMSVVALMVVVLAPSMIPAPAWGLFAPLF
jgi:hypothetical protein